METKEAGAAQGLAAYVRASADTLGTQDLDALLNQGPLFAPPVPAPQEA